MAFSAYNKFLISALLAVAICGATALPVKRSASTCNLLSQKSGKYLVVPSSGPIHANGAESEATNFEIYYSGDKVEFLVSGTSDDYLLIDNGALTTGSPSGGNSEFDEIIESQYTAYKMSPDCYVAFDGNGDIHGPCSLTQGDDETKMTLSETS